MGGGFRKPPEGGCCCPVGPRRPPCRRKDPPGPPPVPWCGSGSTAGEVLFLNFLGRFLFPDGIEDLLLFESTGAHTIPCGPAMESCEVLRSSQTRAVDPDRRLPFHPPDSGCDASFRRNAVAQVNIIHHPVSLDHFDADLLTDLPQDLADLLAQASEDGLLAVRRHDDDVGPGSTTSRALGYARLA